MTFADAKQRFSNRVTDYVRYRPSYPPALLDLLSAERGLRLAQTDFPQFIDIFQHILDELQRMNTWRIL